MRILTLDLSTSVGWAYLEGTRGNPECEILKKGTIKLPQTILAYGDYPFCYEAAAEWIARQIELLARDLEDEELDERPDSPGYGALPNVFVIEETNLGKSRYAQKTLEFIHCKVVEMLRRNQYLLEEMWPKVVYLSSSEWRKNLKLILTKEEKKANAKLAKAKREAAAIGAKLDKKKLGIKGKVTKKHVAINYVNTRFGWTGTKNELKQKDDDIADAICLGCAYVNNAIPCDGTGER